MGCRRRRRRSRWLRKTEWRSGGGGAGEMASWSAPSPSVVYFEGRTSYPCGYCKNSFGSRAHGEPAGPAGACFGVLGGRNLGGVEKNRVSSSLVWETGREIGGLLGADGGPASIPAAAEACCCLCRGACCMHTCSLSFWMKCLGERTGNRDLLDILTEIPTRFFFFFNQGFIPCHCVSPPRRP